MSGALHASRSAVSSALTLLENWGYIRRRRAAGERVDRVRVDPSVWEQSMEPPGEQAALTTLLRQGLEVLADEPPARRARLAEAAAFNDFIHERLPALKAEWRAHRDALRASGELPEES